MSKAENSPVEWVQLQEGEDDKTYFNRVWKQATQTNAGIASRRGGSSYLGLRGVKRLKGAGCQDVTVLRRGNQKEEMGRQVRLP